MSSKNNILRRAYKSIAYRAHDLLLTGMKVTSALWPDELYVKTRYRLHFGRKLDLNYPRSFNEKINWLKMYYVPDFYSTLVDKYEVKKYVAKRIGEECIIPTLGVWDDADKIDFDSLPSRFVLKCNHNSGKGMYICKDKTKMDVLQVREGLRKGLEEKFYAMAHEMQYKNVKPLILAEKYMEDEPDKDLMDYKFSCFNGKAKFCKVDFDRFVGHHANYYDLDWNILPFGELVCLPDPQKQIDCPASFDKMVQIAELLAEELPFVRVDLYNIKGHIYFGELTFTPNGGMGPFVPDEWDYKIGDYLSLPEPIIK